MTIAILAAWAALHFFPAPFPVTVPQFLVRDLGPSRSADTSSDDVMNGVMEKVSQVRRTLQRRPRRGTS